MSAVECRQGPALRSGGTASAAGPEQWLSLSDGALERPVRFLGRFGRVGGPVATTRGRVAVVEALKQQHHVGKGVVHGQDSL